MLPPTKLMVEALHKAGRPRAEDTIRGWRCGKVTMPVWAAPIIADAAKVHLGELVREFARRWEAKHAGT